jgi:hypothetical protein
VIVRLELDADYLSSHGFVCSKWKKSYQSSLFREAIPLQ